MGNPLGGAASGAAMGSVLGPWGTVAGGVIGGVGSLIGGLFGGEDEEAANDLWQQNIGDANRLGTPELERLVGLQGGTEYDKADPATRAAQMEALANLRQRSAEGGLDATGRATMAQGLAGAASGYNQRLQGIRQQAQRFGGGRGPVGYMSQLQASHDVANQENQAGLGAAAQTQQARDQALAMGFQGNTAVRGQDYQRAAAADAIARYNASLRQSVEGANINRRNQGAINKYAAVSGARGQQAAIKMGDADYGRPAVNAMTNVASSVPGLVGDIGKAAGWWGKSP